MKVDVDGRLLALALAVCLAGCGSPTAEAPPAAAESWSVTAWGTHYEVFPEVELLAAGETATAHTHVTRLGDFAPLTEGEVSIVLSGPAGEQVFTADSPVRPGIFAVQIEPEPGSAGEFDVSFRIRGPEGSEQIRGGKVRVGTTQQAGVIVVAPAPRGATDAGEPVAFLKEEQWRSDFATAWVRPGRLTSSVSGLARVRPPAGGEASVTAPVDGVLQKAPGRSWPFVGLRIDRGNSLFQVIPRVAADRSLASLQADLATLAAELETARGRRARLEELLALDAVSRRDVDEAGVRVETLEARHTAAAADLEAARSSRGRGTAGGGLDLRAPFTGEVARVDTSPGATVAAGDPLARLVRTDVVWLEIALDPAAARRIAEGGVRGVVLTEPEHGSVRIEDGLRLVSVAPELSPETGTVTVLLEAPPAAGLVLGTTLDAQVLSTGEREGIVIPSSALVDDGGVPVVYLQLSGESFVRQEVRVLERQGNRLLVDRLAPGQRLVSRGGEAIRRSSLMATGDTHGHMH
ncbi:MAG: efflux RND transporter periplasmic adaptor subunit [bacterium]|nr:efflux RND transporter periplasmic adaptor subunit [bacterium]